MWIVAVKPLLDSIQVGTVTINPIAPTDLYEFPSKEDATSFMEELAKAHGESVACAIAKKPDHNHN